jgi:hypothetical protein
MTTLPITARLPRYRRVKADVSLAMTPRDLQILQAVESFRLLTSEHIQALTLGSKQGILRRLQILFHARLLDRLHPRRVHGGGSIKMVYAVTNKGVRTLQKAGLIKEVTATDRNAQNRELHDFSIDHRLLISQIRAIFTLACQADNPDPNSGQYFAMFSSVCQANAKEQAQAQGHQSNQLRFLFWREGRALQDTIEVALPNSYARIPVAPDGFFGMQGAQGRAHFLVEADRGTMTTKRFTLKLKAYAEYYRQKKHTEKLGIKHFRVLTVTSSAARCKNLVAAAEVAEDVRARAPLFLFTSEENFTLSSPESALAKIWMMPGSEEAQALFGPAPAKNPTTQGGPPQPAVEAHAL